MDLPLHTQIAWEHRKAYNIGNTTTTTNVSHWDHKVTEGLQAQGLMKRKVFPCHDMIMMLDSHLAGVNSPKKLYKFNCNT